MALISLRILNFSSICEKIGKSDDWPSEIAEHFSQKKGFRNYFTFENLRNFFMKLKEIGTQPKTLSSNLEIEKIITTQPHLTGKESIKKIGFVLNRERKTTILFSEDFLDSLNLENDGLGSGQKVFPINILDIPALNNFDNGSLSQDLEVDVVYRAVSEIFEMRKTWEITNEALMNIFGINPIHHLKDRITRKEDSSSKPLDKSSEINMNPQVITFVDENQSEKTIKEKCKIYIIASK